MATKIATKTKQANGVTFAFADKKQTTIEYRLDVLPAEMITQLAIHGLSQKLGDSYSGITNVNDAIDTVVEVWKNLSQGNFNVRASGNGGMLAEAVARIRGITIDVAREMIDKLDEDKVESLKKNQRVKDTMTVIRAERAMARLETGDTKEGEEDALDTLLD